MRSDAMSPERAAPSTAMLPVSGAMMFRIIRMVVVLPAPLGPSRP